MLYFRRGRRIVIRPTLTQSPFQDENFFRGEISDGNNARDADSRTNDGDQTE